MEGRQGRNGGGPDGTIIAQSSALTARTAFPDCTLTPPDGAFWPGPGVSPTSLQDTAPSEPVQGPQLLGTHGLLLLGFKSQSEATAENGKHSCLFPRRFSHFVLKRKKCDKQNGENAGSTSVPACALPWPPLGRLLQPKAEQQ